ncbi:unnamed protein product [Citrullus colocynthis]|uniref:Uncharacterized protein n=1 Tax=Citrullus colocynthis TaxID=252529 RepID=A0ABP0YS61_9ROSI
MVLHSIHLSIFSLPHNVSFWQPTPATVINQLWHQLCPPPLPTAPQKLQVPTLATTSNKLRQRLPMSETYVITTSDYLQQEPSPIPL